MPKISRGPWASLVAPAVRTLPAVQQTGFDCWVGKTPWRREWQPTPVFLPESHGQGSLMGHSPWGHRVGLNWATMDLPKCITSSLEVFRNQLRPKQPLKEPHFLSSRAPDNVTLYPPFYPVFLHPQVLLKPPLQPSPEGSSSSLMGMWTFFGSGHSPHLSHQLLSSCS